jgi:predicted Zn-dependent protease
LKIENGKIAGRVTNAMISGNFYQDFRDNLIGFSRETSCQGAFSGQIGSFDLPYPLLKDIIISSR